MGATATARRGAKGPLRGDRLLLALVVVLCLPLVINVIAALAAGWQGIGDEAAMALRAHDVGTSHSPLLGMPSTYTRITGRETQQPGPLLFYVFAPGVRLLGTSAGLLITGLLVNAAAIASSTWFARRRGGRPLAVGVLLAMGVVVVTVGGGAFLYRPLNAIVPLLPLFLLLVLAWCVACGDGLALPVAVVVASFVTQSDLGFAPVALVVSLVAAGWYLLDGIWTSGGAETSLPEVARDHEPGLAAGSPPAAEPDAGGRRLVLGHRAVATSVVVALVATLFRWSATMTALVAMAVLGLLVVTGPRPRQMLHAAARRWTRSLLDGTRCVVRRLRRRGRMAPLGWATAALIVCWALPAIEAIRDRGGNVAALWQAATTDVPTRGPAVAAKALVRSASLLPLQRDGLTIPGWSVPIAVFVGLAMIVVLVASWGRAKTVPRRMVAVALVATVVEVVALTRIPSEGPFFFFHTLPMVVVGAFLWLSVVVLALDAWLGDRAVARRPLVVPVTASALVLAAAAWATVPLALAPWEIEPWTYEAVDELAPQVSQELRDAPPVEITYLGGSAYQLLAQGLTTALEADGVETRTSTLGSYSGSHRALEPGERAAGGEIIIAPSSLAMPPDATLIARSGGSWSQEDLDVMRSVGDHVEAEGRLDLAEGGLAEVVAMSCTDDEPEEQPSPEACRQARRVAAGQAPATVLPAWAVAQLYRLDASVLPQDLIVGPALPPDLAEAVLQLPPPETTVVLLSDRPA